MTNQTHPQEVPELVERLGETLFVLSGKLKDSGFLNNSEHHAIYEKVVAAFQALDNAALTEAAPAMEGDLVPVPRSSLLEIEDALRRIEAAPAWGHPDKWETTPAEVRHLARDRLRLVVAALELQSPSPGGEALADIAVERRRHIYAEGWTPEHDDEHTGGEMAAAAAAYAFRSATADRFYSADPIGFWPWDVSYWKPSTNRRNLIKAGALIVAEIERLDREALNTRSADNAPGGAA